MIYMKTNLNSNIAQAWKKKTRFCKKIKEIIRIN